MVRYYIRFSTRYSGSSVQSSPQKEEIPVTASTDGEAVAFFARWIEENSDGVSSGTFVRDDLPRLIREEQLAPWTR